MESIAPWWGVPVIAGGFLLLGGILTALYASLNDRRRFKREDLKQWHSDLLKYAIEVSSLATELWHFDVKEDSVGAVSKVVDEMRITAKSLRTLLDTLYVLSPYRPADISAAVEAVRKVAGEIFDADELTREQLYDKQQKLVEVARDELLVAVRLTVLPRA